jgi:hypothetical protein
MAKKARRRLSKKRRFYIALVAIFGMLVVTAATLILTGVINLKKPASPPDVAAYVNGEPITMKELDYSYQYALPEDYKNVFTKWQFLNESIIPQKLLLQEALKHNITITNEEVGKAMNELVQSSGLTEDEFGKQLEELGLTWEDVEATYWTRLTIAKFAEGIFSTLAVTPAELGRAYNRGNFEAENISLEEATPFLEQQILKQKQANTLLALVEQLRGEATISILLEEAKEGITSFTSGGELCKQDGKIPIYMFSSSPCKECKALASRLTALLQSYEGANGSVFMPSLWELDTGDNLYTKEIETGVPEWQVDVFRRLSPQNEVPAYSFGCTYTRTGHLPGAQGNLNAEEKEFKAVLSALLVQDG